MSNKYVVELRYQAELSGNRINDIENTIIKIIERYGFDVIASSAIGMSIAGTKDVIEEIFQAGIIINYTEAKGGTFGPETVPVLSFSRPPTIPDSLKSYIESVKFSPPVIPL